MTVILNLTADEIMPESTALLQRQGASADGKVPLRLDGLCHAALQLFRDVAEPTGIVEEIDRDEFSSIFRGEGQNEPSTPVGDIFPRADRLALFAVTLGTRITQEIGNRFESNDLAVAALLDEAASMATDRAAEFAERRFGELVADAGDIGRGMTALRYSPGYCGWHVSGQGKLFEVLRPERIGISLRERFLMAPLKSVSGVILAGPSELHEFEMAYSFCADCGSRTCRARIKGLRSV